MRGHRHPALETTDRVRDAREKRRSDEKEEPVPVIFLNQFRTNFVGLSTHYTVVKEPRRAIISRYATE